MTTLYRLFDDNLRLLYVGIAGNPGRRFEQHAGDKPWWGDVAHVRTIHFADRQAALAAERQAIQEENPLHNIAHSRKSKTVPRAQRDFDLVCTGCEQPGADYLEIDDGHAMRNLGARKTTEQRRIDKARTEGRPVWIISGDDLLDGPQSVRWKAWHRSCDPEPQADHYWIAADRISRWEHVVDWTAHLMSKRWFEETDWDQLLWGLANNNGRVLRLAA